MATFSQLLATRLRQSPGDPLVTFYDVATGERTELSTTTYANWVAKTAGLLTDDFDLARGDRVQIALPPHWLGPVFEGAAWLCGLVVTPDAGADLVVCGPDPAPYADRAQILASALLPLGRAFPEPLPPGVTDYGVAVWGQPDSFLPWDPATDDDQALPGLTQGELWETAAADPVVRRGGRLVTSGNPLSAGTPGAFAAVLARDASLVVVVAGDDAFLSSTYAAERGTDLELDQPARS